MAYIKYKIYKNTGSAGVMNKFYARAYHDETIDIEGLAEHISNHNTVYSKGTIHGVLMDMVGCIRELLLDSKKVKLDNLAIFSVGIRNKEGAKTEAEFTAANNIAGVKLRARATGTLSNANLNTSASVRRASNVVVSGSGSGTGNGADSNTIGGNTPTGDNSQSGGSSTTGGDTDYELK